MMHLPQAKLKASTSSRSEDHSPDQKPSEMKTTCEEDTENQDVHLGQLSGWGGGGPFTPPLHYPFPP